MDTGLPVKRAVHILGISLGLGLVFDLLFYGKMIGVSFPIYMTLVLVVVFLAMDRFKGRIPRYAPFVALPLLFFSSMVFVRASELTTFLNVLFSLYLLILLVGLAFKPRLRRYAFLDYMDSVLALPVEIIGKAGATLSKLISQRKFFGKPKVAPQVVTGILITLPIVGLFILLFASADLVFRKYVTGLFDFELNVQMLPRLFLILLVTFFFVGILGYLAQKVLVHATTEDKPHPEGSVGLHRWGMIETTILFGSLNVLFLGFIALQLAYLFGGEQNIAGQGFTYAEYARKGFFELIAVAVLSFALITGAEKMLQNRNQTHSPRFKALTGALVAQVLIIMASAFSRLLLYEDAYGFTISRFYAHIFLIWLAVIFCLLLYKIFWNRPENTFAFLSFGSVVLLLVGINLVNVDVFVARQNIDRYHATGKLDKDYLASLSDDAIPNIAELLDAKDPSVREFFASALYSRYQNLHKKDRHWQSLNLAREAALDKLEPQKALLERYKPRPKPPITKSKISPLPVVESPSATETCPIPGVTAAGCATVTNALNKAKGKLNLIPSDIEIYPGQSEDFSAATDYTPISPLSILWKPDELSIVIDPLSGYGDRPATVQTGYFKTPRHARPGTYTMLVSVSDANSNQYASLVTITILSVQDD